MVKISKSLFRIEFIFSILIFFFIIFELCVQPIAGLADNGDFGRVTCALSLEPVLQGEEERYFGFVSTKYSMDSSQPFFIPIYVNTHLLLALITKLINILFFSKRFYDVRILTLFYAVIFSSSLFLILKYVQISNKFVKYSLFILLFIIFADSGNFLYFNSFYAEPAAYVFLFLSFAALFRILTIPFDHRFIYFWTISTFLWLGTKIQYSPFMILFLPTAYFVTSLIREKKKRIMAYILFFSCVLLNLAIYFIQPRNLDRITNYNSVFYCVLANTNETEAKSYLKQLGISEEYWILANSDVFQGELGLREVMKQNQIRNGYREIKFVDTKSIEFKEGFYKRIKKRKIVFFYLRNPKIFWQKINETSKKCFENKPSWLGNRTVNYSKDKASYDKYNFYTNLKQKYLPRNLFFILGFYFSYLAFLIFKMFKFRGKKNLIFCSFLISLIFFSGIQFLLPFIGDGARDCSKQLFMFNVIFDLLLIVAIIYLADIFSKKIRLKNFVIFFKREKVQNMYCLFELLDEGILIFNHKKEQIYENPAFGIVVGSNNGIDFDIISKIFKLNLLDNSSEIMVRRFLVGEKLLDLKLIRRKEGVFSKLTFLFVREMAESVNETVQKFLENVSHEIKTPLATIKLYIDSVINAGIIEQKTMNFLDIINSESDRVIRIIDDIADLSNLDLNQNKLKLSRFQLETLINSLVTRLRPRAEKENISIEYFESAQISEIEADQCKIERVIENIIINSIRYTNAGGVIHLFTGKIRDSVYVKVRDNGIGIPKKDLERVFERFYRVDTARTRKMGGAGLGLSIAQEIIAMHNGEITIESEYAAFTQVTIILPINQNGAS